MEIVVVGCGKVGKTLVEHLAIEGHNVVVIDINQKNVEEIVNTYDVMGICGNGAIHDILAFYFNYSELQSYTRTINST